MQINILLPHKEKFTKENAASVSITVKNNFHYSDFKTKIKIFGQFVEKPMLEKVRSLISMGVLNDIYFISPQIPVSAAIWTDDRGTNARVRGNKRYGSYWEPKEDFRYYQVFNIEDIISKCEKDTLPIPIDTIAQGVGWNVPKDIHGNWLKNPIRPENATEDDYTFLSNNKDIDVDDIEETNSMHEYVDEWLDG